jgi:hypothetical protein
MQNSSVLDIHFKTDKLLDLTRAMLEAAELDNWDEFELQEQERNAILKVVFDNHITEKAVKLHLLEIIKEIQLIDKIIISLISQQRDQAAKELRHLKHARQSAKTYRTAADDSA